MEDIGGLAQYLASLEPVEKAVRREAFLAIVAGQPATIGRLSQLTALEPSEVMGATQRLSDKGIVVYDPEAGMIVGSGGLSLRPTEHSLTLDGRALFTWCAADAIGIPAALGKDARINSICHACGEPIAITLTAGAVTAAIPDTTLVWVVEADTSQSVSGHT